MSGLKRTSIDVADLQRYHDGECSANDIAAKYGCSRMTVTAKARSAGLGVDKKTAIRRYCRRKYSPRLLSQMCAEMAKPDKCVKALSKRFGCSQWALYHYANKQGIALQSK